MYKPSHALLLLLSPSSPILATPHPHNFTHSGEAMEKSQIIKLSLITLLFLITPLLSTSMRHPYWYFLLNLLIITLVSEGGFLSFFKPQEDTKPIVNAPKPVIVLEAASSSNKFDTCTNKDLPEKKMKIIEKSKSEKIVSGVKARNVKKCPSVPSLFFIGGGEAEVEAMEKEEEEGSLSGQELFTKAETFIGNFYKQLKMQREDSWKRIHGFYHKAF